MNSNRRGISTLMLVVFGTLMLSSTLSAQLRRITVPQHSLMPASPLLDEARDIFNAGQVFYDDDKFNDAEKKFREVVTKFPKNVIADKADYYLIRTLSQMGKRNEALNRINSFSRLYPKSKWAEDVQEIQVRLMNKVSPGAEKLVIPQGATPPAPPAPAAPTPAPARGRQTPSVSASVGYAVGIAAGPFGPVTITPPTPPTPPTAFHFDFGEIQNADPQVSLQQEIMRALFNSNPDRAIGIATDRLKSDPADPVVLSILNMVASSRSAQALPMLIAIAKNSTSSKARKDAIFWLGQSRGDKDAVADTLVGLLPTLSDEDSESVTFALGQMRTDKALNALGTIARDKTKSEKVRSGALFGISQSRGTNRVPLLEDVYKANMDNSKIRQQVLFSLSQVRDPAALAVLGSAAQNDPDVEVRKQAVFFIGQSRSAEANEILERLLAPKK